MTGSQRIKRPSLRDRLYRDWGVIAIMIEQGGTPETSDLAWLLRNGQRDIDGSLIPVPPVVQRYLADMIDGPPRPRKRPKLTDLEREYQQRRAACRFRDEILSRGDDVQAALAAYAKENNVTLPRVKRRYRDALDTITAWERELTQMLEQAARISGTTVADLVARTNALDT